MRINNKIVSAYLSGGKVSDYSQEWYFSNSSIARSQGSNIFQEPIYDKDHTRKVEIACKAIEKTAAEFIPSNLLIWNTLFPSWPAILADVTVDLIVGLPQPYDAIVERDATGKQHVIFDMLCWAQYVGQRDITEIVQNLLTHELCHILIGCSVPNIDDDTESKNYLTRFDANTFHEAFAHLVSYKAKEIHTIDWHTTDLEKVKERSNHKMSAALAESTPEIQQKYLYEAFCGQYYEKYACMSGMLYLAEQWETGGNKALKKIFDEGYHGFTVKTISINQ